MYSENQGLGCLPQQEGTFMEITLRNTTKSSEGMAIAGQRIMGILIKMRGNIPSVGCEEKRSEPDESFTARITFQLKKQDEILNFISNQLDELEKLI